MEILKFPDPRLLIKCRNVTVFGAELSVLLESMWETMLKTEGIGLASNQVGLDYNMFVMKGPNGKIFIVNPRIVKRSPLKANLWEGCLSAPGMRLNLDERSKWVVIKYQDEKGEPQEAQFHNIYSVCVQHEIEHLMGRTFLRSPTLSSVERKDINRKWGV